MKLLNKISRLSVVGVLLLGTGGPSAFARATNLVAVSADVVEISGSLNTNIGFSWNTTFDFAEKSIPGIFTIGEFERKTGLATTLKLMEQEGKAQIISNPKLITKSATQADFVVGGELPIPYTNAQGGLGADMKKFGVVLNILPVITNPKIGLVDVQVRLEVSRPDYSKPVIVSGTTIPTMLTRQINTQVELKSGETLVIGGLKSSSRNVSYSRVPFLGKIPLIGLLFRQTEVLEEQRSLFLFVTVEIVN
ncbi:MAG: type II and III secretion system protein [Elusimicrobiaceae bacterium]